MSAGRRPWRQNWSGAGRGNRRGDRKQLGCSHRRSAGRRDVTRATRTFGYPSRYGPPTQRWPRVSHPRAIWGEKCRLLKERVKWLVPQALPQTWRSGCHRVLPNWRAEASICHASLRCAGSRFFNQKIPATSLRGTCSTYDTITGLPPRPPRTQTGASVTLDPGTPLCSSNFFAVQGRSQCVSERID